jgi:hypothetical protein
MKVSLAVMAHPSRETMVRGLLPKLPGATVVYDRHGDRWDTGRRSMLAFDPGADYHCVVQDDAVLCRDFTTQVRRALETVAGKGPVAFYAGCTTKARSDGMVEAVERARRTRRRWVRAPGPWWGVAVAVRTKAIPAMVRWCDERTIPNYDLRMAEYFAHRGHLCWYSVPSLVDHRVGAGNPSLIPGRGSSRTRTAAWFRRAGVERWTGEYVEIDREVVHA